MKICTVCKKEKSLDNFYSRKDSKDGKRNDCIECTLFRVNNYAENHIKEIQEYQQNYRRRSETTTEYNKKYRENNRDYLREQDRLKAANRRKIDITFRLNERFSCAIRISLKGNKGGKSWESLVGYTKEELRSHIQALWTEGMSWNNWGQGPGTWQIDHIVAQCRFDYKSYEDPQFKECWALANLQPVWTEEHIKKSVQDRKQSIRNKKGFNNHS